MKKTFEMLFLILGVLLAFSLIGCDNGNGGNGDPDLSGNITISPSTDVTVGTRLTANYTGNEAVTYQWKRGNTNVGTNSAAYTPDQAGSYTVTVSATEYKSKTSASVSVTVTTTGDGGTFTLTNIPTEYNGKYAFLKAWNYDNVILFGAQNINMSTETVTMVRISNGKVNIPMWIFRDDDTVERYSGNHTVEVVDLIIWNSTSATFSDDDGFFIAGIAIDSVTFTNGNATKSSNDGEWRE